MPIAALATPNIPEAEILSGLIIKTEDDMLRAAKRIGDSYHCAVLLKGGHSINAVSYTHLDVYKRQDILSGHKGEYYHSVCKSRGER